MMKLFMERSLNCSKKKKKKEKINKSIALNSDRLMRGSSLMCVATEATLLSFEALSGRPFDLSVFFSLCPFQQFSKHWTRKQYSSTKGG